MLCLIILSSCQKAKNDKGFGSSHKMIMDHLVDGPESLLPQGFPTR